MSVRRSLPQALEKDEAGGKGPANEPRSYRPLCLLDIVSKLFERILYARIELITESPTGLQSQQYGFRKGKSTLDALKAVTVAARKALDSNRWLGGSKEYCAIITLDVKNAFNTARWPNILGAMRNLGISDYIRGVIGNYFRDRVLWYETEAGPRSHQVSAGVPQGSILLHCTRFVEERAQLVALAGSPLSPRGLVAAMMADKTVWDVAHVIIVTMMKRVR
ncbi:GD17669 [Drosophila simulans]|uniref:GD17669 n=1 Tax=Drosophila simulans TaxID=7240 RepID=B4NSV4_DROSI|nr:GD17669 [Drosophila simulans]